MTAKLYFKFRYLKLELEEVKIKNDEYNNEFNNDFQEEIEYLNSINDENLAKNQPNNCETSIPSSDKDHTKTPAEFKEIYKLLVKLLHPDTQPNENKSKCEERLKEITKAYENKEWLSLIDYAQQEGIPVPDFSEEYTENFEKDLGAMEEDIAIIKNKLAWTWKVKLKSSGGNKEDVYHLLKIDVDKFNEWKKSKN